MCLPNLSVLVLENIRFCPMEYSYSACHQWSSVLPGLKSSPGCLHPNKPDILIVQKGIENANGITTTTDTGDDIVGQATQLIHNLLSSFPTDYHLEVTHH
ncbi:hypothetical protein ES708_29887 [subsurface metagenome]